MINTRGIRIANTLGLSTCEVERLGRGGLCSHRLVPHQGFLVYLRPKLFSYPTTEETHWQLLQKRQIPEPASQEWGRYSRGGIRNQLQDRGTRSEILGIEQKGYCLRPPSERKPGKGQRPAVASRTTQSSHRSPKSTKPFNPCALNVGA